MIPLMKSTFLFEEKTKEKLAQFVRSSSQLSMGEQCALFEIKFAAMQGMKHAICFNSGGSANLAMIQTLKNMEILKTGDSVGFSALTWATNVMPIFQMGCVPVPVDCSELTLNSMSQHLEKRLLDVSLNVFFLTNALGFTGDLSAIRTLCRERGILLIEDNCEALGTILPEGSAGSFGEMSSFSFFVAHHMSTIEGGMVCTNDDSFANMLRMVRANGWDRDLDENTRRCIRERNNVHSEFDGKYTFYNLGYNLRPTEITGFLGQCQMELLNENICQREKNHLLLERVAKDNDDLYYLEHSHISRLSSFAFPVVCKTPELRERYMQKCIDAGVEIRPMIAGNIQKQPFYKKHATAFFDLPGTDIIDTCGFYFGNYPELTKEELAVLQSCLEKK